MCTCIAICLTFFFFSLMMSFSTVAMKASRGSSLSSSSS